MAKTTAVGDIPFPAEVYSLSTLKVASHRVALIPQSDVDERRSEHIDKALQRMRQRDREKYPGLYDPE